MPMDYAPLRPYHVAARMDEAVEEQGTAAYITPDRGLEIDGKAEQIGPYEPSETPDAVELIGPDAVVRAKACKTKDEFDALYKTLNEADRKRVDAIRKPRQKKEI